MSSVLVVDDEPADLNLIARALEKSGLEVKTAASKREAFALLESDSFDAAVFDILLPDGDGMELLQGAHKLDERLPIVFATGASESARAIEAMKLGALDYLLKPINVGELREVVQRAVEIRSLAAQVAKQVTPPPTEGIIGCCPAMQDVYKSIGIVAPQNVTVLVRGESGTGKELVARALFQHSDRKGPFLAVNCAAIPEMLLESELFGHEKGAFTGADRKRIGKFEECDGGTLFLDEVGDMSPVLQSKLLRVLQDREIQRIGSNEVIRTDVRLIAATHQNLEKMVADGSFRADLYYRLNGFTIHLPPLRERGSDLDLLIEFFRADACRELGKEVHSIAPQALDILRGYAWPGNIRELQNIVRQGILKTVGPVLLREFLPEFAVMEQGPAIASKNESHIGKSFDPSDSITEILRGLAQTAIEQHPGYAHAWLISQMESTLVEQALAKASNQAEAAEELLGIGAAELHHQEAALRLDPLVQSSARVTFDPEMTLQQIERVAIEAALKRADGCRKSAAQSLGISTRTMQRRVKEFDLDG